MLHLLRPRFDFLVGIGCVALLAYFAWHGSYGPRGRHNAEMLQVKLAGLQDELAQAQHRKAELEARVVLMRPEHVDPDLLEELARRELGWVGPQDLIVKRQ
jgi:cell division protein FtsB